MARPSVGNTQRLNAEVRVDPRLVVAGRLLRMASADLEAAIENELAENPALERSEPKEEFVSELPFDRLSSRELNSDEEAPDLAEYAADAVAVREHIRADLRHRIPRSLGHVADYLVGCLTDTGYLEEPVEEVALACGCSIEDVEQCIAALHQCDPPGIGARNVVECLLIQLRHENTLEGKVAREIVANHLDALQTREVMLLARKYRVMPDVVSEAFTMILALRPYPLDAPAPSGGRNSAPVRPDVVLRRDETGWQVEVPGPGRHALRVSGTYRRAAGKNPAEQRHLSHYVQRAQGFLDGLEQRRRNLKSLGEALIRHQSGFVLTGDYAHLAPLTRAKLAKELGVHESTISRATADKFVQIATGEVIAFDVFFRAALRVQRMIEEILSTEDPSRPLSDERIAQILAERGVVVARRTVNKYRDRHKLPSSRRRRSA